jgi:hypothetical protein
MGTKDFADGILEIMLAPFQPLRQVFVQDTEVPLEPTTRCIKHHGTHIDAISEEEMIS